MNTFATKIFILLMFLLASNLFSAKINQDSLKSEMIEYLKKYDSIPIPIGDEHYRYNSDISSKMQGSKIKDITFFRELALKSKNPYIRKNAYFQNWMLLYDERDYRDFESCKKCQMLVNEFAVKMLQNDTSSVVLNKVIGDISDEKVMYNYYKRMNHFCKDVISKNLSNQNYLIDLYNEETDNFLKYNLLYGITNQRFLKKLLKSNQDNTTKELIYWRLNNDKLLEDIILKETNDTLKTIAQLKLEYLRNGSKDLFKSFFDKWEKESVPISDVEFSTLSEIEQNAYLLAEQFITDRYTRTYDRIYIETSVPRLCITNSLAVKIDGKFNEDQLYDSHGKIITINNFRPRVNLGKPILYLNNYYKRILTSYLDRGFIEFDIEDFTSILGNYNYFSYLDLFQEDYRGQTIRKRNSILKGVAYYHQYHSGKYGFQPSTTVEGMVFNPELTKAVIGEIYYKINGKWMFIRTGSYQTE